MNEKPMLVGWDDGKIYLYLGGKEYCVSDEPELLKQIIALCRQYFEQKVPRRRVRRALDMAAMLLDQKIRAAVTA